MMANDAERYFEQAWNNNWSGIDLDAIDLLARYGVSRNLIEAYVTVQEGPA